MLIFKPHEANQKYMKQNKTHSFIPTKPKIIVNDCNIQI